MGRFKSKKLVIELDRCTANGKHFITYSASEHHYEIDERAYRAKSTSLAGARKGINFHRCLLGFNRAAIAQRRELNIHPKPQFEFLVGKEAHDFDVTLKRRSSDSNWWRLLYPTLDQHQNDVASLRSLFEVSGLETTKVAYLLNNRFCPERIVFHLYPNKFRGREKPQIIQDAQSLSDLRILLEDTITRHQSPKLTSTHRTEESNPRSEVFDIAALRIEQILKTGRNNYEKITNVWKLLDGIAKTELRSSHQRIKDAHSATSDIIDQIASHAGVTGLYAIDYLQPALWLIPEGLQYFIKQSDQYTKANWNRETANWDLRLSPLLIQALKSAQKNAQRLGYQVPTRLSCPLHQPESIKPLQGPNDFEIARILLWETSLLRSELGHSVVRLHQERKIPVFHLPLSAIQDEDQLPPGEYIIGGSAQNEQLSCSQSILWTEGATPNSEYKINKLRDDAHVESRYWNFKISENFERLLQHPHLLLAEDVLYAPS
ncbi:MAG: hypothetical protein AAGB46_19545 [Verrucomicrobiota bacterium]